MVALESFEVPFIRSPYFFTLHNRVQLYSGNFQVPFNTNISTEFESSTVTQNDIKLREICSSHSTDFEQYCLPGCEAVKSGRSL